MGGEFKTLGRIHDVNPGFLGSIKASYRIFAAPDDPISLTFTGAFGASFASTTAQDSGARSTLRALDLRVALTVSRTLWDVFTPWFSARAFAGPVSWNDGSKDVVGTDPGHHQLAIGAAVALGPVSLSLEWAFLGERALFGGAMLSF